MGNSASSSGRSQHEETVDYGQLFPQGVYTGPRDWNQGIVTQLIIDRRLAPFYRPLEEFDDSWDDEQILAARKEPPDPDVATSDSSSRVEAGSVARSSVSGHGSRRQLSTKEPLRIPEATVYHGAVECPICFLYYPPNINHSRCCDQAICTECFVQIKRAEPTTTHLVSEPAACPYCVQENFGVTYTPPPWRTGIGSEGSPSPTHPTATRVSSQQSVDSAGRDKTRRKSFSPDAQEVVTIDHIRPDWEAKLAAVRAAVQRRANRRIIMRQVGDRLIPVGVTSGRIHPLNVESIGEQAEANPEAAGDGRGSRRSRRRHHQQAPQDLAQLLGGMAVGGQDLEEMMVMEAMRLSLIEHEEQQRREAEAKKKAAQSNGAAADRNNNQAGPGPSTSAGRPQLPPIPTSRSRGASPAGSSPASDASANVTPSSLPSGASPLSSSPLSATPPMNSRSYAPNVPSPLSTAAATAAASAVGFASPPSAASLHGDVLGQPAPALRTPSPHPRRSGEGPSPGRYSALSAALAAHSTASAIVGGGDATGNSTEQGVGDAVISASGNAATITAGNTPAPTNVTAAPAPVSRSDLSIDTSGRPDGPQRRSSTSLVDGWSQYNELPSSPESSISHQRLLRDTSEDPDDNGAGIGTDNGRDRP